MKDSVRDVQDRCYAGKLIQTSVSKFRTNVWNFIIIRLIKDAYKLKRNLNAVVSLWHFFIFFGAV